MYWFLAALGAGFLLLSAIWLIGRGSRGDSPGVIEVRTTPRREIEQLTVNEFRRLGLDYLRDRGYDVSNPDADAPRALREGREYLVHFDPADEARNPRTINQLIARQRREGVEGLVLVTTAELDDQAARLSKRGQIEVLDPPTLIGWRRSRESPEDTDSSDASESS